ncbi:MAG: acetate--CoA ligase family protein, partial [Dehalococcoidales bacterium]|nr:acetate--CoA ligase family protein [Dehalococcoidales bacterium]
LTAWIGGDDVAEARRIFNDNRIPVFEYPEDAIRTYLYMYNYARNLEMLYETPEESPIIAANKNHIKAMIHRSLKKGITSLNTEDVARFLSTYGIPFPAQEVVTDANGAVEAAVRLGFPVVVKIASPDTIHKSDIGGVVVDVRSAQEVKEAYDRILTTVKEHHPDVRIDGVIVQKMVPHHDYELIIGCKKDPACGPIIMFGMGGIEAEFFKDIAAGLPPLNQVLARRIIEQTRIYQMLAHGFRTKPAVDLHNLDDILVKVSNMIVDFPEIKEMDINPLVITGNAVTSLDARIILDDNIAGSDGREYRHLIITPYPSRHIQPWTCKDGRQVLLRPVKPDDELLEKKLFEGLPPYAMRYRFMHVIKEINHDMLTRFCNIDYDREMAIIAEYVDPSGEHRNVGTGTLAIPVGSDSAEFAVVVAKDFENAGLALKLCDMIIGIAQEKQLKSVYGTVLSENTRALGLAKRLGCTLQKISSDETRIVLEL